MSFKTNARFLTIYKKVKPQTLDQNPKHFLNHYKSRGIHTGGDYFQIFLMQSCREYVTYPINYILLKLFPSRVWKMSATLRQDNNKREMAEVGIVE